MTKYLVIAKEWRDKINGNSYFSAQIESTSNNKIVSKLRFQYGYGNHSLYMNSIAIILFHTDLIWSNCHDQISMRIGPSFLFFPSERRAAFFKYA